MTVLFLLVVDVSGVVHPKDPTQQWLIVSDVCGCCYWLLLVVDASG